MKNQLTPDEVRDCLAQIFPEETESIDDALLDALIKSPSSFERPSSGQRFDWTDPETIRAAIQALQFAATMGFGIFNARKKAPSTEELKEKVSDDQTKLEDLSEEERERIIQKVVKIIEDRARETQEAQHTAERPSTPKDDNL